ncbi:MAG TPA: hypothetical protein VLL05_19385 [Terriglobales bacterium]|nr:hypothetical protein [Terriglobales bacterium]
MAPRAIDSLDMIEIVMAVEEVFEVDIPDADAGSFGNPRGILDWFEARLSNQRPNKVARALLRKLAHDQQSPELAEGLDGTWRREQIAAIVREIFRGILCWSDDECSSACSRLRSSSGVCRYPSVEWIFGPNALVCRWERSRSSALSGNL